MINEKQGQLKKVSLVVILVLLLAIIIITAQNIIEETQAIEVQENADLDLQIDNSETINTGTDREIEITDNTTETINLCENIDCNDSTLICPDNFTATCENFCIPETGTCASCTPSCDEHEQIIEQNQTEVTNETIENETQERTEGDETTRLEQNETIPFVTGEAIIDMPSRPELDIQISYQEKITRGEIMEIKATVTNSGDKVKNIRSDWSLPKGFDIIYRNQESCENLYTGESC
ncbi:MAG: hypothetical protein Q8N98_02240 [bacterium]|nr:hypothetical protein [bacterium]